VREPTRDTLIIGINASRNRSGGAKNHLIGILSELDPSKYGIGVVHVWSYKTLLDHIPDKAWLKKHNPTECEASLIKQVWWERYKFHKEAKKAGCDIVLNTDAGTVSKFRPSVTMSRDMLEHEASELSRFGFSKAGMRLRLLRKINYRAFMNSDGVIFLSEYAAKVIQMRYGELQNVAIIPHGVSKTFKDTYRKELWPRDGEPIKCVYVSNIALYKHQWNVVRAVSLLRKKGFNLTLILAGGGPGSGRGKAEKLLNEALHLYDPQKSYTEVVGFVPYEQLPSLLAKCHLFIFASSCENMPNTLLEGMAVGLPIACSDRGPMPEILKDGGVYFDPEDPISIAGALEKLILDGELREKLATTAKNLSMQYSWSRCADETIKFIVDTYKKYRGLGR